MEFGWGDYALIVILSKPPGPQGDYCGSTNITYLATHSSTFVLNKRVL